MDKQNIGMFLYSTDGKRKQSDHLNTSVINVTVIAHVNCITSYINICFEKKKNS